MGDDRKPGSESSEAAPPKSLAQVTPKFARSYDEMNTSQMVFEMQGTIGELKEAITALGKAVEASDKRLEKTEKTSSDIKDILTALTPKIDNLVGFATHAAPNFATKADIATLTAEIALRPTRWQSLGHMALLAGLVAAILAIGAYGAH
jgi:hypothetical protein